MSDVDDISKSRIQETAIINGNRAWTQFFSQTAEQIAWTLIRIGRLDTYHSREMVTVHPYLK